jgi:hypothetical protein
MNHSIASHDANCIKAGISHATTCRTCCVLLAADFGGKLLPLSAGVCGKFEYKLTFARLRDATGLTRQQMQWLVYPL